MCNLLKDVFWNDENPLRLSAPSNPGVYLVGNTLFNPHTHEEIYLVKIGRSSNLKSRMKTYQTDNPGMFHIAFLKAKSNDHSKQLETVLHNLLWHYCEATVHGCNEWFKVNRDTYLSICEEKFDFFKKH